MKWNPLFLLLPLFLLALFLLPQDAQQQLNRFVPEITPFASSYNQKPSGYSALYELCQRTGLKTAQWQKSYRDLKTVHGALLFVAPIHPPSDSEVAQILEWVDQGNDFVLLDKVTFGRDKFLAALKMQQFTKTDSSRVRMYRPDPACSVMTHVPWLFVNSKVRFTQTANMESLLVDGVGTIIAQIKYGRGRFLIVPASDFCANKCIAEKSCWGNFQFLINWLKQEKRDVFFDERCHGYRANQSFWSYVLHSQAGAICGQLLLLFVILLWSLNQRFGATVRQDNRRKLSGMEFVNGLASTYTNAKAYDLALSVIFNSLKSKLCKALGATAETSVEDLSGLWAATAGVDRAEALAYLQQTTSLLERGGVSQEELLKSVVVGDRLLALSAQQIGGGTISCRLV
ncbi:MAG: DUF4350 domain-containing protein [Candidatus Obscuribacterales bacterium]|nr:DUF4350 domain-containing protein [Candidatus Obscuribacterales bacterium]